MKSLIIVALAALFAGCTSTHIVLPDKTEITRTSFLTNPTIGPLDIAKTGEQTATFKMGGYSHEQIAIVKQALDLAAGISK